MVLAALEATLGVIDRLARWCAGVALLAMTLVLFGNSAARYLFNVSFVGGEELARVLAIWSTFLAAYLVVRVNAHVAIDVVLRLVGDGPFRAISAVTNLIGAVTMAYVTWYGIDLCERIWAGGQMSSVLPMMKVVFYLPIPIGCGLMTLAFLINMVHAVRGELARPEEAVAAAVLEPGE